MATSFDRWEKDPFFSAAEEVQESADRMESTYRTWMHAKKDASSMWNPEELRRDLRTALGTTKWQLEEFGREVRSSYVRSSNDDTRDRHCEFIVAIENQILNVENALQESSLSGGKPPLPWVRLDEEECNELALFLSGPLATEGKNPVKSGGRGNEKLQALDKESATECSKSSSRFAEWGSQDTRDEKSLELEKLHGHRRAASASADIGAWKIAVLDDSLLPCSSNPVPHQPVRKIPSLSGFLGSMESASRLNWSKNGFRKWKATDGREEPDTELLQPTQLTRGIKVCYDRSKSCLDGCDDCYDKQLYGWYGAIQRQLQRSQYHMQYSRPVQITIWIVLLLCLIGKMLHLKLLLSATLETTCLSSELCRKDFFSL